MFWNNYRPIPATSGHFMNLGNSKNLEFSVFLGKFGNFFFQNTILDQIGPRIIEYGFSEIPLGPKDGLYRFLIHFWAFKILSFHAFFMLKSVVFACFDATWHCLGPEDDLYRFLIHFWGCKNLNFFAFFMLKSVVFASFEATWLIIFRELHLYIDVK